jgi:hypothetical protein
LRDFIVKLDVGNDDKILESLPGNPDRIRVIINGQPFPPHQIIKSILPGVAPGKIVLHLSEAGRDFFDKVQAYDPGTVISPLPELLSPRASVGFRNDCHSPGLQDAPDLIKAGGEVRGNSQDPGNKQGVIRGIRKAEILEVLLEIDIFFEEVGTVAGLKAGREQFPEALFRGDMQN